MGLRMQAGPAACQYFLRALRVPATKALANCIILAGMAAEPAKPTSTRYSTSSAAGAGADAPFFFLATRALVAGIDDDFFLAGAVAGAKLGL